VLPVCTCTTFLFTEIEIYVCWEDFGKTTAESILAMCLKVTLAATLPYTHTHTHTNTRTNTHAESQREFTKPRLPRAYCNALKTKIVLVRKINGIIGMVAAIRCVALRYHSHRASASAYCNFTHLFILPLVMLLAPFFFGKTLLHLLC